MLQFSLETNGRSNSVRNTRKLFLHAYERTCGNVSASCEYAGISRQTYYRWMKSPTRTNQRFRDKVEGLRPKDRLIDLAESRLIQKINEGDTTAILFALRTKGRTRGWTDTNETRVAEVPDPAQQAVRGYMLWLNDNPDADRVEKTKWVGRFAKCGGVSIDQMLVLITGQNKSGTR